MYARVYNSFRPAQGRHVDVALGTLQQHIGPPRKLSGELRSGADGRTGLRIRRQRLQKHLSDEIDHLRVIHSSCANPRAPSKADSCSS